MGEERVVLEDGVDRALVGGRARHVAAAEQDPAGGRLLEAGESRSVVVLPQPDGPSSEKNSPSGISSDQVADGVDVAEALAETVER